MPQKAVVDAVEARLAARWTQTLVLGINLTGDVPDEDVPFLQVQYPVSNVSQMDLAGTLYREDGAIRLILNVVRGEALGPGYALADDLAKLFRGRKFDGVQTFAPGSPVVDDRNEDGRFFGLSFAVPYQFDFTDAGGFYA